jgi:chromate reductase, NAD(P)H dehydrogenase (quinone)
MTVSLLVLSGSARTGSHNERLAKLAAVRLQALGATVNRLDVAALALPLYHGDIEAGEGVPVGGLALHEALRGHDGVFIASPEYNGSAPPLLVNALAWASRVRDHGGQATAFGKPVYALGAASPGALGGYRGLMALRQLLELGLFARVLPAVVTVPAAHEAFDENGALRNARSADALERLAAQLIASVTPG